VRFEKLAVASRRLFPFEENRMNRRRQGLNGIVAALMLGVALAGCSDSQGRVDNGVGWYLAGYIEDKTGALRPQSREELTQVEPLRLESTPGG
jgi:hypothetical protein